MNNFALKIKVRLQADKYICSLSGVADGAQIHAGAESTKSPKDAYDLALAQIASLPAVAAWKSQSLAKLAALK